MAVICVASSIYIIYISVIEKSINLALVFIFSSTFFCGFSVVLTKTFLITSTFESVEKHNGCAISCWGERDLFNPIQP